jgi:mono/diheme cytochrome c family protein
LSRNTRAACLIAVAVFLATGCRQDMHDQPKYEPLEASDFFADGRASRPVPAGTVSRSGLRADAALHTGRRSDGFVTDLPVPLSGALLARGRERYGIFCTPCHGVVGDGKGMVVQRGFPAPTSFHIDRLRSAPVGYFYDVVTNGYGRMQNYAAQISVEDRWAVVAYLRALQLSQNATPADVPAADRTRLDQGAKP